MQRAAAGEEFFVTRRGKPFARLSPPVPQLATARPPATPKTVRIPLMALDRNSGSGSGGALTGAGTAGEVEHEAIRSLGPDA